MLETIPTKPTVAELVDALNALGVHFLIGGTGSDSPPPLPYGILIASLAESSESRVRLALVSLFLHHPRFSHIVASITPTLSATTQLYLHCFYTAAHLFQQKYAGELADFFGQQPHLPDLFSDHLNIPTNGSPQARLQALADRHATLSGRPINWLGTYEHAAERTLKRLQHERSCQA